MSFLSSPLLLHTLQQTSVHPLPPLRSSASQLSSPMKKFSCRSNSRRVVVARFFGVRDWSRLRSLDIPLQAITECHLHQRLSWVRARLTKQVIENCLDRTLNAFFADELVCLKQKLLPGKTFLIKVRESSEPKRGWDALMEVEHSLLCSL